MPILSKIITINGTEYDICDATARAQVAGAIKVKGKTTTALTDESTTNPITINGESYTAVANDAVFYNKKEFIFDGQKWNEFGDMSGLGRLATKDSASGVYTPSGTVSTPTVTVVPSTDTGFVASSSTGGGAVTPGSAASCTLPELTMTVQNETLIFGWASGSFTPNTPTDVTMPSFTEKSMVTGISSASATQPTFTGDQATIVVS